MEVASILYFFSAFLNVFLGIATAESRHGYGYAGYRTTSRRERRNRGLCSKIFYYSVCFPPYFMLWKAPGWSILRIRFFKRYTGKFRRSRMEQSYDAELVTISEKQKPQPASVDIFIHLLNEERILKALGSNLHFVDVLNLSSTCKAVRRALVSPSKEFEPHENLRVLSCEDGSKLTCSTCNSQICRVSAHCLMLVWILYKN